ncbi:MAG TPA: aminotransferase class I/II-fold pyridoxal phosphate-dependent enzyme [Gemmatimonadaceae bacterium]|nr:aminotransferase class I/II-fold pyridoxal phosphate-dependent enzyme [Gemmatimonadaceae bacterium]
MTPSRKTRPGISTLAVRGGAGESQDTDAPVVTPLFQSTSYVQEFGSAEGVRYPRYGNTPNAEVVQRRLASLAGAESSLVLSSGMGATACALLALLRPGDHLLASAWVYGGTSRLLTQEFATMGINVTLVDPMETRAWRRRLRKETRAIYVESPVNPTCRVLDLRPISYLTKEDGLALVVDSTFASPVNFRPIEHGADVVVESSTKYLNGHHDALGGVVCGTASYIEEVRQKMMVWGQAPDPFACWLLERGLKTLDVRVRRQNESATRIAEWAAGRKEVKRVHYPGLSSHPDHEAAKEMLEGFGGMLALELSGGARATERFLRRLRLFTHAPSLGGVESLVSEPRYTSHAYMTPDERARLGIPEGLLRFSVGLEDADDLIADLEQALR